MLCCCRIPSRLADPSWNLGGWIPVAALKKLGTLNGVPVAAVTAEFKARKFAPLLNPVVNAVAPAAAADPALPGVAATNGSPGW